MVFRSEAGEEPKALRLVEGHQNFEGQLKLPFEVRLSASLLFVGVYKFSLPEF